MTKARMSPFLFRFCYVVMFTLDWIPGYCRYYTVETPQPTTIHWVPRFGDMRRHWMWRQHAEWGFRLLVRMKLVDDWADECERRSRERKSSSTA